MNCEFSEDHLGESVTFDISHTTEDLKSSTLGCVSTESTFSEKSSMHNMENNSSITSKSDIKSAAGYYGEDRESDIDHHSTITMTSEARDELILQEFKKKEKFKETETTINKSSNQSNQQYSPQNKQDSDQKGDPEDMANKESTKLSDIYDNIGESTTIFDESKGKYTQLNINQATQGIMNKDLREDYDHFYSQIETSMAQISYDRVRDWAHEVGIFKDGQLSVMTDQDLAALTYENSLLKGQIQDLQMSVKSANSEIDNLKRELCLLRNIVSGSSNKVSIPHTMTITPSATKKSVSILDYKSNPPGQTKVKETSGRKTLADLMKSKFSSSSNKSNMVKASGTLNKRANAPSGSNITATSVLEKMTNRRKNLQAQCSSTVSVDYPSTSGQKTTSKMFSEVVTDDLKESKSSKEGSETEEDQDNEIDESLITGLSGPEMHKASQENKYGFIECDISFSLKNKHELNKYIDSEGIKRGDEVIKMLSNKEGYPLLSKVFVTKIKMMKKEMEDNSDDEKLVLEWEEVVIEVARNWRFSNKEITELKCILKENSDGLTSKARSIFYLMTKIIRIFKSL